MIISSKRLAKLTVAEILPELSPAALGEVTTVAARLIDPDYTEKELHRTHIEQWLKVVSLPTLKAITKLIDKEVGIPEEDQKGAASNG